MTDPRRPGPVPSDPTEAYTGTYAYSDPAYSGTGYGSLYSAPTGMGPTEQLPPYWTQTNPAPPPTGTTPDTPPPDPPRGSRPWLWGLAGFAVAAVVGLVAYLVFVVASPSKEKSVAAPSSLTPTTRAPARPPSLPPGMPSLPPGMPSLPTGIPSLPPIPIPGPPGGNTSGETEPVSYDVDGEGMALTISYNDTGGMMQSEFGVELPWHKDVDLPKPAKESASIIVTNSGKNITCSISVGGKKVVERKSALLTVCPPATR